MVECIENDLKLISPDGSLNSDKALYKFNREFLKASIASGIEPSPGLFLEDMMKKAGFEDVTATKFVWPVGTWPADKHLVRHTIHTTPLFVLFGYFPVTSADAAVKNIERNRSLELPADPRRPRGFLVRAIYASVGLYAAGGGCALC